MNSLWLWGIVIPLLLAEATDLCPWVAKRLVRRAVHRFPEGLRLRYEEEWLGHLEELPGKWTVLINAISLYLRAPSVSRAAQGLSSTPGLGATPFRKSQQVFSGYSAYITYSHSADGRLAPALQRGLHRLAKPWYRLHALRVFRDESGLAVTPTLWSTITATLDHSEYLVVLASPEAAKSRWVAREIEYWKATKPVERILLVITDGECHWDAGRCDFDPDRSTALPPSLLGLFIEEPRYLDLRWARSEIQLDLRHSRFRDAIAQLAAPIHGRCKDELECEDIRMYRRSLRLVWSAIAILVILLLITILQTVAIVKLQAGM